MSRYVTAYNGCDDPISQVLGEQLTESPEVFNDCQMPARTLGKPTALQGSLEDAVGLPPMRLERGILTEHTEAIDSLVPFTSQVADSTQRT